MARSGLYLHNISISSVILNRIRDESGALCSYVQLHSVQLRFFGNDLIDVRLETRIRLDELAAETSLDGRLDLRWSTGLYSDTRVLV